MTAVTSLNVIAGAAGPILHDFVGPFAASPTTPFTSDDQDTHMRAPVMRMVLFVVGVPYPKNTPR